MITFEDLKNNNNTGDQENSIDALKNKELMSLDDNYWSKLLFFLIAMQENETRELWENFVENIKYKSHFFPQNDLLNIIKEMSHYATNTLPEGLILYRAREYTESDFREREETKKYLDMMKQEFCNLKLTDEDIFNNTTMFMMLLNLSEQEDKVRKITDSMKKIGDQQAPFWGFDKKNSDAPPSLNAKEGRANAKGISYLYTALDEKTAILELRPQLGKMFNIGKIQVTKQAKIFDFTYSSSDIEDKQYTKSINLYTISEQFSKPNFGDSWEYLPTQYLCEYIRRLGFDGIKYKSSVSVDGYNILFFDTQEDTRLYDIIESKVFLVKSLNINIEQVYPMN